MLQPEAARVLAHGSTHPYAAHMPKKAAPKVERWRCPACKRLFARRNQAHICNADAEHDVLRGRPESVVRTYAALAQLVKALGPVELFARERYVLMRSARIFADVVIMADAVRIAIHVDRSLHDPIFFKVVSDGKKVTHVAKLHAPAQVEALEPYLREAYAFSLR